MFECRACKAKDEEIAHLQANVKDLLEMLDKAQARVMELAEPGVNRRMAPQRTEVSREHRARFSVPPQFPGYEPRVEQVVEVDEEN